ncbi:IS200/IS605 family transposase (plasmid) [Deinococcus radiomollis]|uniref:IS200/IS605 family transposase n=1 Tax=Deinococcus radiomollis TaxID=468916 RepID=UPI0038923644
MPEERSTRHAHFNLNYHLVFTPKYRRRSFSGPSRDRLMEIFTATCTEREWEVLGMEVMPDHVHVFVSCPPKWAPSDIAKILKGVSARLLLQDFPALRRRGHLWTNAYYVGSAGNISADVIQRYIANQRKHQVDDDDV